jgi:phosphatidylserine/phosphatidylglycerophosphate/cardiolipin synthase-like enzyme
LTTAWLCPRFRTEFALEFGPAQEHAAQQAKQRLPRYYRKLPRALRFIGPWHEAQARMQGRPAGTLARLSNRFWLGQPLLPFAGDDRCTHDTDRRQ